MHAELQNIDWTITLHTNSDLNSTVTNAYINWTCGHIWKSNYLHILCCRTREQLTINKKEIPKSLILLLLLSFFFFFLFNNFLILSRKPNSTPILWNKNKDRKNDKFSRIFRIHIIQIGTSIEHVTTFLKITFLNTHVNN